MTATPARCDNRDTYCWGANPSGQLGNGTTVDQLAPTPVSGGTNFNTISAGGSHTCAVRNTGVVWCWGASGLGQIGASAASAPVQLTPFTSSFGVGDEPRTVTTGDGHSCGVKSNGVVVCWGYNFFGQVGNGNTTNQLHQGDGDHRGRQHGGRLVPLVRDDADRVGEVLGPERLRTGR